MHSSRMLTVRCSGRPGGCLPAREGVCPGEVSAQGGCLAAGGGRPPVDRMTDMYKTLPCRNYFADGKNWPDMMNCREPRHTFQNRSSYSVHYICHGINYDHCVRFVAVQESKNNTG